MRRYFPEIFIFLMLMNILLLIVVYGYLSSINSVCSRSVPVSLKTITYDPPAPLTGGV